MMRFRCACALPPPQIDHGEDSPLNDKMQARSRTFFRLQSPLLEQSIGKRAAESWSSGPSVRQAPILCRLPCSHRRSEPVCRYLATVSRSETGQQNNNDQVQQISDLTRRRPITNVAIGKSKELLPSILANAALPVADRLALLNQVLDFWKMALDRIPKTDLPRMEDMIEPEQFCLWIQAQWIRGQLLEELHHEALQTTFCSLLSVMARTRLNDDAGKNQAAAAAAVHQVLDSMPIPPSIVVWNAALTVLAKWHAASDAWDLFQRMKQEPDLVPNIISYSCVLEALVHEQAYGFAVLKAQGLLHEMINSTETTMPNSICYFHYLRILIADNQLDIALKTLQELASSYFSDPFTAVVPNQYLFAAVMTACAKQGEIQRTTELLQLLQTLYQNSGNAEFLVHPKSLTNVLNGLFASASDKRSVAQTMTDLLLHCRQLALEANDPTCLPQTNHYNKTMEAWTSDIAPHNRNAIRQVEELMHQMLSSACASSQPNKLSYTTLMKALARSKHPQATKRCQELLNDMWNLHERYPRRNTKPDGHAYNIAILSCSHAARRDADAPLQADALYRDMIRRYNAGDDALEPTEATYVAAMTAWNHSMTKASPRDKHRAVARCRLYFDEARVQQQLDNKPVMSSKVYTAMLDSLKEIGDAEQADAVFQDMLEDVKAGNSDAVPTMETFHTLMTAWARSRSADAPLRAEALLDRMKELHDEEGLSLEPQVMTYNIILNCWAKSGREEAPEQTEEIVRLMDEECMSQEIEATKLCPDATTHGTVLEAWSRSRLPHAPSRALAYLNRLQERFRTGDENWRPTQFHFATVMNAFASVGDTSRVTGLMQRMELADIAPNTYCYNALIKAIVRSEEPDAGIRSEEVLRAMIQSSAGQARPDVATFTSCISAWEKSPSGDALVRADELVIQCIDRSTPNAGLFLAYLRLLRKCDGVDKAQKAHVVIKQMKQLGIPPTKHILQELKECRVESHAVSR